MLRKTRIATFVSIATASLVAVATAHAAPDRKAVTGTEMKADGDMADVLESLASLNGKPIESLDVAEARKQPTPTDAVKLLLSKKGKPTDPNQLVKGVTATDRTIPGATGAIPARVYTPEGKGPFPVIVYYHGGGWVIADKDVYDGGARGLAKAAKAVVVSVDYRRAPEAKFPAAWDDALAAYKWTAQNAASINGDPAKLATAGESAGGNLAISTAIAAKKANLPLPKGVLAVYPVAQTGNLETASYKDSASAKPLNKPMIGWFVDKVFANQADKSDPRVDLVHADLAGLPPVTIINAEIDPLRSDGDLIADALKKAGVPVEHKVYNGVTHEFFGMAAVVGDAADAQKYGAGQLTKAFKK